MYEHDGRMGEVPGGSALTDSFSRAVDWIVSAFEGRVQGGKIFTLSVEPSEFTYWYGLRFEQANDGMMTIYTYPPGAVEWLCMKAETDKGAFDIVCRVVASKLFRNEPLSEPLRTFAGLRVVDRKPSPKGRKAAKTVALNLQLLQVTKSVAGRFGLALTRNDASPPFSACDAVSSGLSRLGHSRSWRSIKELIVNPSSESLRILEAEVSEYMRRAVEEDPAILERWVADRTAGFGTENVDPPPS